MSGSHLPKSEMPYPMSGSHVPKWEMPFPMPGGHLLKWEMPFPMSGSHFPKWEMPFPMWGSHFPKSEMPFPMPGSHLPKLEMPFLTPGSRFPKWEMPRMRRPFPVFPPPPDGKDPLPAGKRVLGGFACLSSPAFRRGGGAGARTFRGCREGRRRARGWPSARCRYLRGMKNQRNLLGN